VGVEILSTLPKAGASPEGKPQVPSLSRGEGPQTRPELREKLVALPGIEPGF